MQAKSSPKVRRAVLGLVLYEHPAELTSHDLRHEFGDDARQAIVDLLEAGLLAPRGRLRSADSACAQPLSAGTALNAAERFGENLRRQRRLTDMSQDEVAFRAGVHRTEISQLERGLRHARVDTVAKLAAALEVDPGVFFDGIVWERPRRALRRAGGARHRDRSEERQG
jgi:DNA-binding XRE family transcriptional regulator